MILKRRSNSFQVNFGQVQERFYREKYTWYVFPYGTKSRRFDTPTVSKSLTNLYANGQFSMG